LDIGVCGCLTLKVIVLVAYERRERIVTLEIAHGFRCLLIHCWLVGFRSRNGGQREIQWMVIVRVIIGSNIILQLMRVRCYGFGD